jgi:hypothetical protein
VIWFTFVRCRIKLAASRARRWLDPAQRDGVIRYFQGRMPYGLFVPEVPSE